MSGDPAIEAARRAWQEQAGTISLGDDNYTMRVRTLAAREALKPIRELHWKRTGRAIGFGDMPDEDFCNECSTMGQHISWPCATARLVYPESELA